MFGSSEQHGFSVKVLSPNKNKFHLGYHFSSKISLRGKILRDFEDDDK